MAFNFNAAPSPFFFQNNVQFPSHPYAPPPPLSYRPSPVLTVYIGNLPSDVNDQLFDKILRTCGPLNSWKRAFFSAPFGFADFDDAFVALRTVRILVALCTLSSTFDLTVKAENDVRLVLRRIEEGSKKTPENGDITPFLDQKALLQVLEVLAQWRGPVPGAPERSEQSLNEFERIMLKVKVSGKSGINDFVPGQYVADFLLRHLEPPPPPSIETPAQSPSAEADFHSKTDNGPPKPAANGPKPAQTALKREKPISFKLASAAPKTVEAKPPPDIALDSGFLRPGLKPGKMLDSEILTLNNQPPAIEEEKAIKKELLRKEELKKKLQRELKIKDSKAADGAIESAKNEGKEAKNGGKEAKNEGKEAKNEGNGEKSGKKRKRKTRRKWHRDEIRFGKKSLSPQEIIRLMPLGRKELYRCYVDWAFLKKEKVIESKMRVWVDQKLFEFIGTKEKDITNYVIDLLNGERRPKKIEAKMKKILDEDSEDFVTKLMRRLHFEIINAKVNGNEPNNVATIE